MEGQPACLATRIDSDRLGSTQILCRRCDIHQRPPKMGLARPAAAPGRGEYRITPRQCLSTLSESASAVTVMLRVGRPGPGPGLALLQAGAAIRQRGSYACRAAIRIPRANLIKYANAPTQSPARPGPGRLGVAASRTARRAVLPSADSEPNGPPRRALSASTAVPIRPGCRFTVTGLGRRAGSRCGPARQGSQGPARSAAPRCRSGTERPPQHRRLLPMPTWRAGAKRGARGGGLVEGAGSVGYTPKYSAGDVRAAGDEGGGAQ
jgi:hypothetical protein